MPKLTHNHSAIFRIIKLCEPASEGGVKSDPFVVQERMIVPMNAVMGRHHLDKLEDAIAMRAPGMGRERFYVKRLDYYDRKCSSRHCIIELDDEQQPRIRDLSSTNGTWRWNPKKKKWARLTPGLSYLLNLGQRFLLAEDSQYAYEFVGASDHAFVRIRFCDKSNGSIIDEHDWEWRLIAPDGSGWRTSEIVDAHGNPRHNEPHFSVFLNRVSTGSYQAKVFYDSPPPHSRADFYQSAGSKFYGAELDDHEELGPSEVYQVGYELLLPGRSGESTQFNGDLPGQADQIYLRLRYLVLNVELDQEGWTKKANLDFYLFESFQPDTTEIKFHSIGRASEQSPRLDPADLGEDQLFSEKAKTLRHAIVCALVNHRLQDQAKGRENPAWVSARTCIGLTTFTELSDDSFFKNLTRWRKDISAMLENSATNFQRRHSEFVAIPDEQDWKEFVQLHRTARATKIRLHPQIRVMESKTKHPHPAKRSPESLPAERTAPHLET